MKNKSGSLAIASTLCVLGSSNSTTEKSIFFILLFLAFILAIHRMVCKMPILTLVNPTTVEIASHRQHGITISAGESSPRQGRQGTRGQVNEMHESMSA